MSGLPVVTVIGTLTADAELRFTPSGVAVASFTVAANERRYDRDSGQWTDGAATFLRCSAWRQAAENLAESVSRGDRVIVTGRLKQREYQTREGEKRTAYELDVDDVGPSVKWATTKVTKAQRSAGDTSGGSLDPWGPSATAPSNADSEPPF